jgi:hypothetical protein
MAAAGGELGAFFSAHAATATAEIARPRNFAAGNRTIGEVTDFTNRTDVAEFLKKRISEALGGKIVLSRNVTYDDLRDLIIIDYTNNGRKSLGDLKTTRLKRLDATFGGTKAIDISTTSVERYKTLRLKDKAAPATVNRELASLKRMFRLGLRQSMVSTMPHIAMFAERNVRRGFFELDQFQAILKHLPSEYHSLFEIAYITGCLYRHLFEDAVSNSRRAVMSESLSGEMQEEITNILRLAESRRQDAPRTRAGRPSLPKSTSPRRDRKDTSATQKCRP